MQPANPQDLNCLSLAEQQNLAGIKAKSRTIVSVAQFRPEKDHALQVRAMAALKALGPKYHDIRLEMIGACRNEEDEQRVQALKTLVQELDVQVTTPAAAPQPPWWHSVSY